MNIEEISELPANRKNRVNPIQTPNEIFPSSNIALVKTELNNALVLAATEMITNPSVTENIQTSSELSLINELTAILATPADRSETTNDQCGPAAKYRKRMTARSIRNVPSKIKIDSGYILQHNSIELFHRMFGLNEPE